MSRSALRRVRAEIARTEQHRRRVEGRALRYGRQYDVAWDCKVHATYAMWRHEDACAELKSEEKRILASTPEDSRALARARSEVQLAGIRASVARRWAWRRQCAEDRAWRRNYRVDQARFAVQDALERLRSEERRLVETLEHAPRRTP